jgi:hypothetical protein
MIVHGRSLAGEDVGRKPVGARKLHSGIVSKGAINSRITVGRSDEPRVGGQKTAVTVQLRFQLSQAETGKAVDPRDTVVARAVKPPHVGGKPLSPPINGRGRAIEPRRDRGSTRPRTASRAARSSTVRSAGGWTVRCRRDSRSSFGCRCGSGSTVGGWRRSNRTRGS